MSFRSTEGEPIPNLHAATVRPEDIHSTGSEYPRIKNTNGGQEIANTGLFTQVFKEVWDFDKGRSTTMSFDTLISSASDYRVSIGLIPVVPLLTAYFYTYESLLGQIVPAIKNHAQKYPLPFPSTTYRILSYALPLFECQRKKYRIAPEQLQSGTVTVNYADYVSTQKGTNKIVATIGGKLATDIGKASADFIDEEEILQRGSPKVRNLKMEISTFLDDPVFMCKFINALYARSPSSSVQSSELISRGPQWILSQLDNKYESLPDNLKALYLLKRLVRNGNQVLDMGTGIGLSAWLIALATHRTKDVGVYGIDPYEGNMFDDESSWLTPPTTSSDFFMNLRKVTPFSKPEFIKGSALKINKDGTKIGTLPFKNNSLDIVVAGLVMRYFAVEHGQKVTDEVCRVLKPGGKILIIESPNPEIYTKEE